MTWIELDDGILDHPKFIRAVRLGGSQAVHLWLGLRAYCSKNLTDGEIPADMLDEVRGPKDKERTAALKVLIEVGLIRRPEPAGPIRMHDYLQWSSSREMVLERREKARERKARSRAPSQPESHGVSRRDTERTDGVLTPVVTNPRGRDPLLSPSSSTPEEEDPPTPLPEVTEIRTKPRDRMAESFRGENRHRPDVLALFDDWKLAFGFPEAKLCVGIWNADADTLAEAIDNYTLETCRLVLKYAPNDGKVSGRDDERKEKHESIAYIFGKQTSFLRILRAAKEAEARAPGSVAEQMRQAAEAQP